jgi:hypothetical protein
MGFGAVLIFFLAFRIVRITVMNGIHFVQVYDGPSCIK